MEVWLARFGDWMIDWLGAITIGVFALVVLVEAVSTPANKERDASTGRMITNFGLTLINAILAIAIPVSSISAAAWAAGQDVGVFNLISAPWWLILVSFLLARTFTQYWLHRAMHGVPILWRIHQIHHSDTSVDVTLSLREHPIDIVPRLIVFASVAVLLGAPVWAVVIVDTVMMAFNFWEHADARTPARLERALRSVITTPEFHRFHHSASQSQTDSNYGSVLAVWDRLFGTFIAPGSQRIERLGLGEAYDFSAASLFAQLSLPFKSGARSAVQDGLAGKPSD